jgi:hypothetical protein
MSNLIDKDVLVAEIRRRIDCCYKMCAGDLDFLQKSYPEHYYSIETYKEILSIIDALEVKEVDLKKEIANQYESNYEEYLTYEEFADIAKHFFELGMQVSNKSQKGE